MKKTLDTSFTPGGVLMIFRAGSTVSLVVWVAPLTTPST
jgi:hypothetical protein